MFQYALGRKLADKYNTSLRLDISGYKTGGGVTRRHFLLSDFNIKADLVSEEISQTFFDKVQDKFDVLLPYYSRRVVNQIGFGFDENILKIPNNSFINGYWQSEKYFAGIAQPLRDELILKKPFQDSIIDLVKFIKCFNTVSVHFRRGDYLVNEEVSSVHGFCDFDYYSRAINMLSRRFDNIALVVFSDDMEWVKSNFKSNLQIRFVENYGNASDEICLMSLCKHNIIANSTFSWWGAWLNRNPEKIVVAPEKWFATTARSAKDLVPESWIKL